MEYLIDENKNLTDINNWKTENFGRGKLFLGGDTSLSFSSALMVGSSAESETGMKLIPVSINTNQIRFWNYTDNTLRVTAIYGSTVKTVDSAPYNDNHQTTNISVSLPSGGPILLIWSKKASG